MIRKLFLFALVCVAAMTTRSIAQTPLTSEFTYQGALRAPGMTAISTADFQFSLWDATVAGNQIGVTLSRDSVALSNGIFTVFLNFGATAFSGDARWLQFAVRSPAGAGGFTTLTPRQVLTSAPNATYSHQTRGVSVSPTGDVTIGSPTSANALSVAGDLSLGTSAGQYRRLRVQAANTAGFLFSALQGIHAGINLGFNHYIDENGNTQYIHPGGTSRLTLGSGSISLALNPNSNEAPIDQLSVNDAGSVFSNNVGIGVQTPDARLHVRGPVRFDVDNAQQDMVVYDENDNEMWALGQNAFGQPAFFLISPVTNDLEAGFYRDEITGNGVMFADDKNFRAPNPADPATDIWYCCPEGPEAAMYIRGTGRLVNGRATIELPDHFRNLASEPGMTVQLTPSSANSRGIACTKKSLFGIEVVELGGGSGDYEFDWRVEAMRKGWEDYRVIRPWLKSNRDPDKAWQSRLKWIDERRAQGKPSPDTNPSTPRPKN